MVFSRKYNFRDFQVWRGVDDMPDDFSLRQSFFLYRSTAVRAVSVPGYFWSAPELTQP